MEADRKCLETALQVFDCISSRDFTTLRTLLDDAATLELPFAPEDVPSMTEGADNIVSAITYVEEHFSRFALQPHEVYFCEDRSTAIIEATSIGFGTNSGTYQNRYIFVFEFSDGRILRWREYLDPLRIHRVPEDAVETVE